MKQGKSLWARVFLTFLEILLQPILKCCLNLLEEFGSKKHTQNPNNLLLLEKKKKKIHVFVLLLGARPQYYTTLFSLGAKKEGVITFTGV